LKGFTKVEVLEFDDKQIEKFIDNWFGASEPEKAKSDAASMLPLDWLESVVRQCRGIFEIVHEQQGQ